MTDIRLWAVIGGMAVIIVVLVIKIYSVHKATREITEAFAERLAADTNTLIDVAGECAKKFYREKPVYNYN